MSQARFRVHLDHKESAYIIAKLKESGIQVDDKTWDAARQGLEEAARGLARLGESPRSPLL